MAHVLDTAVQSAWTPEGTKADGPALVRAAPPPDLLTVPEASKMLRVPDATVRSWIEAGRIPYVRQGREYRIPAQGLLSSLDGTYGLSAPLLAQNARMSEAELPED